MTSLARVLCVVNRALCDAAAAHREANALAFVKTFSDLDCAKMFTLELSPNSDSRRKARFFDEPFCFNDVRVPLWSIQKRWIYKKKNRHGNFPDSIKPEICDESCPPGSKGRIEALAAFYDKHEKDEISAFSTTILDYDPDFEDDDSDD